MHSCKRLTVNLSPSLTEEVHTKLTHEGIKNILDFLLSDLPELSTNSGINLITLQNIRKALCASVAAFPKPGNELLAERIKESYTLLTGYQSLDDLLGGGLKSGEVIEIFGSSGTGKTHLCLKIGLNVSLIQNKKVLFLDPLASVTSSALRSLIEQFANKKEIDVSALESFEISIPSTIWEVLQAVESVHTADVGSTSIPRLIIIDSLPYLMYPLMGGGSSSYAFGLLNHLQKLLKSVAKERNLSILVVNFCVKAEDPVGSTNQVKVKPALGRMWAYTPHTRLSIENAENHTGNSQLVFKKVNITKSTNLPTDQSCIIQL